MGAQIWKWRLKVVGDQEIETPDGWEPLCVDAQNGVPCIWAKVFPSAPQVKRKIYVVGTGHPMLNFPLRYLGSFQLQGGAFVGHIFEG